MADAAESKPLAAEQQQAQQQPEQQQNPPNPQEQDHEQEPLDELQGQLGQPAPPTKEVIGKAETRMLNPIPNQFHSCAANTWRLLPK